MDEVESIKRGARKEARAELVAQANVKAEAVAKDAISYTDSSQGRYFHNEIIDLEYLAKIAAELDVAEKKA